MAVCFVFVDASVYCNVFTQHLVKVLFYWCVSLSSNFHFSSFGVEPGQEYDAFFH